MNRNSEQPNHAYPADLFNTRSAEIVVPRLIDLLRDHVSVSSVVDVGCGTGTWLAVMARHGVQDGLGLDGGHISPDTLVCDPSQYKVCDLLDPPELGRRFDLCLCLEVGEHMVPDGADGLVNYLISVSDIILFSAAIPGQGGQRHLNEQWPDYWAEKFDEHGFRCNDGLRHALWNESEVEYWYRQNMLLFIRDGIALSLAGTSPLRLVHPDLFARTNAKYEEQLRNKGGIRGMGRELLALGRKLLGRPDRPLRDPT